MGVLDPNRGIDPLIRSYPAAKWASANWELLDGELGLESDTGRMKYGIGSRWLATPYVPSEGPVQSVNGATGVVTLDYLPSGAIGTSGVTVAINDGSPGYGLLLYDTPNDGISFFGVGTVILQNLPTSDPGSAGQLWNDAGTLKVSGGQV